MYRIERGIPADVGTDREYYHWHDEADVEFTDRAVIDFGWGRGSDFDESGKRIGSCEPHDLEDKTILFDIEVSIHPLYNIDVSDPKWPIATIQWSDNYHVNPTILIIEPYEGYVPDNWRLVLDRDDPRWKRFFEICCPVLDELIIEPRIVKCRNEKDLLRKFRQMAGVDADPDRFGGWFSDGFDWPYLYGVGERLDKSPWGTQNALRGLSPIGQAYQRHDGQVVIKGRDLIDLMDWDKQLNKTSQKVITSYDFKDRVRDECGIIYADIGANFREYYMGNPDATLEYCCIEALAMHFFVRITGVLGHYDSIRGIIPAQSRDVIHNSKTLGLLALQMSDEPLPSKKIIRRLWKDFESFKGATVIEPEAGIHERVAFYDVKSMYPTFIDRFNLSPETRVSCVEDADFVIGNRMWFKSEPRGLIPRMTEYTTAHRNKLRKEREKHHPEEDKFRWEFIGRKEKAAKALDCSQFGVSGSKGYYLYDPYVAGAITKLGRDTILFLADIARAYGKRVLYGDTDGLEVYPFNDISEALLFGEILAGALRLKARMDGIDRPIEIKMEKFYRRILFKRKRSTAKGKEDTAAKKNYMGWITWEDGFDVSKTHIMGASTKRSDRSKFTREVMTEVIDLLLKGEKIQIGKAIDKIKNAYNYVRDGAKDGRQHDHGTPRGLRKDLRDYNNDYWANGTLYSMEKLGVKYTPGFKPVAFPIKGVKGLPKTHVACLLNDEEFDPRVEIDWELLADKTIKKNFEDILLSLGMDWLVVTEGLVQSKL